MTTPASTTSQTSSCPLPPLDRTDPAGRRLPEPSTQDVAEHYPPGTKIHGRVWKVVADLQRAWIDVDSGHSGAVAARDVGPFGVLRINQTLQPGQIVHGICLGVVPRPHGPQIQVALPELPVPTVDQQLYTAGVVPGARFDGRALKQFGTSGLFVQLMPGIKGLLEDDELDPARYPTGSTVSVVVNIARENPTRPGAASVRLTLDQHRSP